MSRQSSEFTVLLTPFDAHVERLGRTVLPSRIALAQAIAIEEDYPAQRMSIVDAELPVGLWKEGLETRHPRVHQPEEIAYVTTRFFEP